MGGSSAEAVKKQSSDWSSGWDADDSWSNEKDADGQGQSSPGDEGWGHDWDEEADSADSLTSAQKEAPDFSKKSRPTAGGPATLPEGTRLASEYNWDNTSARGSQNDFFSGISQRAPPAVTVRWSMTM